MLPCPPKMAAGQDFVKKAMQWISSLVLGMEGKAHLQGWQGHPNLVHPPRAPKYFPKTPSNH